MSHITSTLGLSSQDYYYLKCWVALVRVGKKLLIQLLQWGFPNPQHLSLRQGLQELEGYSNTKYKNDFNKDERKKIEYGTINDFDITLLNTLIQRLCRLVSPILQISNGDNKLSELILKVKDTRNSFAHPILGLTETEMSNHVNDMKVLFELVISEAETQFGIDTYEINNLKNEIGSQLIQIVQSPLPAASISEQLAQVAAEKSRILVQEGVTELHITYKHLTEVSVTPWPFVPVRRTVTDIFVKNSLKFHSSYCLQNRLTDAESRVDVDNLLIKSHLDGSEPGFILLTGQSGIGKSTILKYITESWINSETSSLANIDRFDLIFYIDCRNSCLSSIQLYFAKVIPNTANLFNEDELKSIIMSLDCLFLLDNLDEVSNQSIFIVNEIISATSSTTKIIATASQDPGNLILQKSQHKRPMNLLIEGIAPDCTRKYVNMLYKSLPENYQTGKVETFFTEIMAHEFLFQDWLTNPEILAHVFLHWCFSPDESARCSTLTKVLLQSFNLILTKMKTRILSKILPGVVEQHILYSKLQCFLLELGRIAMSSLKTESSGLGFKSTSQLLLKCQELGLPANILLSEFLCFRESFDEKLLQTSVKVNFPSVSFQEFCSAYHLFNLMLNSNKTINLKTELCLDALPLTSIHKSRLANILKFFVGILATNNLELLDELTDTIMDILQNTCEVRKSCQWFQILEESQGQPKITNSVLAILKQKWQVEDSGISRLVVDLIESSPPDDLNIVSLRDPSTLPHFRSALEACSSTNHRITLSLYIYSQFWKYSTENSDQYLNIVTRQNSFCQVENFAGQLSTSSLLLLPTSLRRLALQLQVSQLNDLNSVLPHLLNLNLLSLNISFNVAHITLEGIEPVAISDGVMLSLDLWGASPHTANDYCSFVASISSRYTRLAMRRTTLDFKSVSKYIVQLGKSDLHITSLVIGSTCHLKSHENVNLTSDARNHLGATNFKWIDL